MDARNKCAHDDVWEHKERTRWVGQALTGELVQDIEHTEGAPIVGPVMHEVTGPDVVLSLGT